jgi:hypothetical protein
VGERAHRLALDARQPRPDRGVVEDGALGTAAFSATDSVRMTRRGRFCRVDLRRYRRPNGVTTPI